MRNFNLFAWVFIFFFAASLTALAHPAKRAGGCCTDDGRIAQLIAQAEDRPQARARSLISQPVKRVELGLRHRKIDKSDQLIAIMAEPTRKTGIGDPDFCTVTVYQRFCRVVSNNPYIEQCYQIPMHVEGNWNEKKQCCEINFQGRRLCVKGAIYLPW